jgi:hypothetical protein
MANLVTFDAYLRYVRRQSSATEACAVSAWLVQPAHAGLTISWMQQYVQLLAQEAAPASVMPDFDAIQDKLLTQLELVPASALLQHNSSHLARVARLFHFSFHSQEFLGLRALFHRLYWQ